MAFASAMVPPGSGGGGETLSWARDEFAITAAFSSGSLFLGLTETPVSEFGIFITSEGDPLHPSDYVWDALNNGVFPSFAADPATDTDTGTWHFVITYQYEV